jgi:hypothetical protein
MGVWRPRGVVLHNTGSPTLAQFNRGPHGPITDQQRILNSIPDWQKRGFSGCPHGFVMPGRFTTANPFWKKGTHSPSWNGTFWGIEMGGDFDAEAFPPETLDFATHVLACLYAMLGHEPEPATFHLHKEDPGTTHKHCPGKNAGDEGRVDRADHERMRFLHPGELSHDAPAHEEPKQTKATVDVPAHDFLMLRKAPARRRSSSTRFRPARGDRHRRRLAGVGQRPDRTRRRLGRVALSQDFNLGASHDRSRAAFTCSSPPCFAVVLRSRHRRSPRAGDGYRSGRADPELAELRRGDRRRASRWRSSGGAFRSSTRRPGSRTTRRRCRSRRTRATSCKPR